jgi:hypothetical protein
MKTISNAKIARSLDLWNEYFNTSALMTDAEFHAMSIEQRLAMLDAAFGPDHALTGKPSNNTGKLKAGAKRATLALRLAAEDKELLQTQAKAKGVSVSRHVTDLFHKMNLTLTNEGSL